MQIKIISDEIKYQSTDSIAQYNGKASLKYHNFNENPAIQQRVNDFCKKHDVVSITPSVAILGNNPPCACMIYTIVYKG